MIARFRPTYTYADIFSSQFADEIKSRNIVIKELQNLYKTKNIFLFGSGREALYILLKSLNVSGGVLSPAYNCIVVPDAIRFSGMSNQFVDISLDDYNMNAKSLLNTINTKSKVLLATHQFGVPCDIERIKSISNKHNLLLIEDAAAAMGAKIGTKLVGTHGKASIISFQDTKVINGIEGGALIVHDERLANKVKNLIPEQAFTNDFKYFGKALIYKLSTSRLFYDFIFKIWTTKSGSYTTAEKSQKIIPHDYVSNMKFLAMNLIGKQIKGLSVNVLRRQEIANMYMSNLSGGNNIVLPKIQSNIYPAWTRFPVRVKNKKLFFEKCIKNGVDLAWTFSYSCPKEYKDMRAAPNALIAAKSVLDLPIYPNLSNMEIYKIISAVKDSL